MLDVLATSVVEVGTLLVLGKKVVPGAGDVVVCVEVVPKDGFDVLREAVNVDFAASVVFVSKRFKIHFPGYPTLLSLIMLTI